MIKPKQKYVAVEEYTTTVLGRTFNSLIPENLSWLSEFDVKGEYEAVQSFKHSCE